MPNRGTSVAWTTSLKSRIKAFLRKATSNLSSHILIDLVGTLDEEQKLDVIESNLESVLSFLLPWPYQNYFIEILKQNIVLFSAADYTITFKAILQMLVGWLEFYGTRSI